MCSAIVPTALCCTFVFHPLGQGLCTSPVLPSPPSTLPPSASPLDASQRSEHARKSFIPLTKAQQEECIVISDSDDDVELITAAGPDSAAILARARQASTGVRRAGPVPRFQEHPTTVRIRERMAREGAAASRASHKRRRLSGQREKSNEVLPKQEEEVDAWLQEVRGDNIDPEPLAPQNHHHVQQSTQLGPSS